MLESWYILYTFGSKSLTHLQSAMTHLGIVATPWVPKKPVRKLHRGKMIVVEDNLFENYVFLHTAHDVKRLCQVVEENSIGYFLHRPGDDLPYGLTEEEIVWINTVSPLLKDDEIVSNIKVGTYVEIVKGTFMGTMGQVKRVSKKEAVVDAFILGRYVPVSVPLDCIEQAGEKNGTQE